MKYPNNRFLGIDYGRSRLGLAISDPDKIIATPCTMLSVKGKDPASVFLANISLLEESRQSHISALIVGLPVLLSGLHSAMTREVEAFIQTLKDKLSIPVFNWEERLSSAEVERLLRDVSKLSRKKRAPLIDSLSAQRILQSYLEANKNTFID